jgi:signal transduction histidine kinase
MFDLYFRREVPDEGETLLAFVDGELYRSERASSAAPAEQLGEASDYWLSLRDREEGTLQTGAGFARYVAVPLRNSGHEALFVAANFPSLERNEIDDAVRTQAFVQFGMIIVATLIGIALAGRVLRPLSHLADTAQTISATDLTRRIPVRGEDEASRIATAFNEMLERIERSFATQRQFLDDASHELRSPMTVIRGHVELLEFERDPAEREAMSRVIIDEIDRMNRIVEELLLLARSERPGFLTMEPVKVAELIDDVHRRASVLCSRAWITGPHPVATLTADRQLLTQAMLQLAQNVCQHTPEGTTARIGASLEGSGRVVLWVEDDGPGVPPDQASRVFERFAKGSDTSEGSGLGLSIVAAIAEAHGGEARLVTPGPKGARFEISVPIRVAVVLEVPTPVG